MQGGYVVLFRVGANLYNMLVRTAMILKCSVTQVQLSLPHLCHIALDINCKDSVLRLDYARINM